MTAAPERSDQDNQPARAAEEAPFLLILCAEISAAPVQRPWQLPSDRVSSPRGMCCMCDRPAVAVAVGLVEVTCRLVGIIQQTSTRFGDAAVLPRATGNSIG